MHTFLFALASLIVVKHIDTKSEKKMANSTTTKKKQMLKKFVRNTENENVECQKCIEIGRCENEVTNLRKTFNRSQSIEPENNNNIKISRQNELRRLNK